MFSIWVKLSSSVALFSVRCAKSFRFLGSNELIAYSTVPKVCQSSTNARTWLNRDCLEREAVLLQSCLILASLRWPLKWPLGVVELIPFKSSGGIKCQEKSAQSQNRFRKRELEDTEKSVKNIESNCWKSKSIINYWRYPSVTSA